MPEYRRGREAIEDAAKRSEGGGNFRPFVPEIRWQDADEKKFVLILTPIDEVGEFELHEWIPVAEREKSNGETYTQYEAFLSRKDPFVGEDFDKIEDELERKAKTRCMGVAVELEPVMEVIQGRQKPSRFKVKTATYTKNSDDGEQEVTQPVIGLIVQSSALMWSPLSSHDESINGPITELPLEITRRRKDKDTRYDIVPLPGMEIDLAPVIAYLDGLSYLSDDLDDIIADIEATDEGDELAGAQVVARAIFDKRLAELADGERYEEMVGPIEELPDQWGKGKRKKVKRSSSSSNGRSRPSRRSPRKKSEPEPEAAEESAEPAEEEAAPSTKEDRFAALKARVESGA